MSKKSKILLASAAAVVLLATALFLLLPQIVRWSIPRIIEAQTGYRATIETVDLSFATPSVTLGGIALRSKAEGKIMGAVNLLSFAGSWGNPFAGRLISPRLFLVHGVDAQLDLSGQSGGGSADLDYIFGLLFELQTVAIDAKRLDVITPGGHFKMEDVKASIAPPKDRDRKANRALNGSMLLKASGTTGDESPWSADGALSITGEITPEAVASGVAEFNLKSLRTSHAQAEKVTGAFPFSIENKTLRVKSARLETPALRVQSVYEQCHPLALLVDPLQADLTVTKPYSLTAQASVLVDNILSVKIDLSGKVEEEISGTFTMIIPELKDVTSHAAFQEKKDALRCQGVSLAGKASVAGDFHIPTKHGGIGPAGVVWKADCSMESVRAALALPAGSIDITLQDNIQVRGSGDALEMSGDVGFSGLKVRSSSMQVDGGSGRVRFGGDADRIEIKEADAALQAIHLKEQPGVTLKNVKVKGTGLIDMNKQDLRNGSAVISIDGMGPFTASVTSLSPLDATVEARSVSLKNVLDKVSPVSGFFKGWSVDGSLDLSLHAKENLDLSGSVGLKLTTLSDPKGRYAAQNLVAKVTLASSLNAVSSTTTLKAKAGVKQGEALLGSLYLDFGVTPAAANVTVSSTPKGMWINKGKVNLAKGGSVAFHSTKKALFPMKASLGIDSLDEFFTSFVKNSLADAYPVLKEIEVKGKASCELSLQPDFATGRLLLSDASMKMDPTLTVQNFQLDLPLAYSFGKKPLPNAAPRTGRITLGLLETENFQLRNQDLGLRYENNVLTVNPVRFPFADGIVIVSDVALENPYSDNPGVSMLVSLRDIKLGKLQILPPPYELTGTLGCKGLKITGNRSRLRGEGDVSVDLFEGHAKASDFSLEDPLSPFRRLKCSIFFNDIDLEKFTRAFSFGRITGKLDGTIEGLAVSNGQADAFTLNVWSDAVKGVDQTVSFNAVDDIQTISSGTEHKTGLPFGLDRFIGDLSYQKIGIRCVLKNDVFRVNGTVKKDNKEFFVTRGGLTGINVVNMNTNNQISFKDMVERIRRVAEKRELEVK